MANEKYNHEEELEKVKAEIAAKNGTEAYEERSVETVEESSKPTITISDGTEITFNFEKLTGRTIIKIKEQFQKLKKKSPGMNIEELDDLYYILVAERVSSYSKDYFLDLKYQDYAKVKVTVRDFLNVD